MRDQNNIVAKFINFFSDMLRPAKIRGSLISLHTGITDLKSLPQRLLQQGHHFRVGLITAVAAALYPPQGNRSVGGSVHALNFAATPADYYANATTNHYARIVHAAEAGGLGYAFPYDDVTPDGGVNQAGPVSSGSPAQLSVTVGAVAATGMSRDDESRLFRFTIKHSILLMVVVAVISMLYAYVFPHAVPSL